MHFLSKYTGQSMKKVIWNIYYSKKRLIVPIIKKFNVLIRQITQQKFGKKNEDPKAYLHNIISHQEKYVFNKIRTHYILNRMNKTKKKKNYPKVMNVLNTWNSSLLLFGV